MTDQPSAEALHEAKGNLWRDLCEKDDRTSPEEYPEMALITEDEFYCCLDTFAAQAVAASRQPSVEHVMDDTDRRYEAPRDPSAPLRVRGVGRVADEPRALLVMLTERPTDDELRALHDHLRDYHFLDTASERAPVDAGDLERARFVLDRWCGTGLHYIPCDPDKGEDPQAYLSLLFGIQAALAEARRAGKSAGWDAAVQELRNVGGSWSCDSSQIADYLADTKPRALTPSPEGRSS